MPLLKDGLLVQNLAPSTSRAASSRPGRLRWRSPSTRWCRLLALLLGVGLISKLVATFVVPGPEAAFDDTWHSALDRSFLTHTDLFSAGMLVAVLRAELEQGPFVLTERTRMALKRVVLY